MRYFMVFQFFFLNLINTSGGGMARPILLLMTLLQRLFRNIAQKAGADLPCGCKRGGWGAQVWVILVDAYDFGVTVANLAIHDVADSDMSVLASVLMRPNHTIPLIIHDCHSGVLKRLLTPLFLFISSWRNLKCGIFTRIYSSTYIRQDKNRIRLVVSCKWAYECIN
jgi:hypothetical protein